MQKSLQKSLIESRINYVNLKDEEVIALSLEEPDAFSEIVSRYEEPFRQAARRILGGDDAEDAVQEAFVKMYINAGKYKKRSDVKFSSWAYTILVRVCYSMYSRNKKRATFTLDHETASELEDVSLKEFKEHRLDREHLLSLVSRLPVLFRRVIELYIFDHKSEKEIAEIEGISYGLVRTRISRAKAKLRELNRFS